MAIRSHLRHAFSTGAYESHPGSLPPRAHALAHSPSRSQIHIPSRQRSSCSLRTGLSRHGAARNQVRMTTVGEGRPVGPLMRCPASDRWPHQRMLIPDWHQALRMKVSHFIASNRTTRGPDGRMLLYPFSLEISGRYLRFRHRCFEFSSLVSRRGNWNHSMAFITTLGGDLVCAVPLRKLHTSRSAHPSPLVPKRNIRHYP